MIALSAFASIALFVVALWLLAVVRVSGEAVATARGAVAVMRDPQYEDEQREVLVQRASLKLMGAFLSILLRSALALLISCLPIYLAGITGQATADQVLAFLSRWDVIVLTSMAMIAGYFLYVRLWPTNRTTQR